MGIQVCLNQGTQQILVSEMQGSHIRQQILQSNIHFYQYFIYDISDIRQLSKMTKVTSKTKERRQYSLFKNKLNWHLAVIDFKVFCLLWNNPRRQRASLGNNQ